MVEDGEQPGEERQDDGQATAGEELTAGEREAAGGQEASSESTGSGSAEEPPPTAPRRRRRAASRPAGPPAHEPDGDQVQLFATSTSPDAEPAEDSAPGDAQSPAQGEASNAVEPGTEEPGAEEPGTDEPSAEEPGTDEPSAEEPGAEEPGTEGPGTEEPSAEEPGTEEPSAEESALGQPGTDQPGTQEPTAEQPGTPDSDSQDAAGAGAATDQMQAPEPASQDAPDLAATRTSPPVKRPRRATRGVTTVAFSAVPEPDTPATVVAADAPAAALFQPPDETKAVRRNRRTRPSAAHEAAPATAADDPSSTGDVDRHPVPESQEIAEDEHGDRPQHEADQDPSADDAPRRRRRRGGRRRRRSPVAGEGENPSDDNPTEDDPTDDSALDGDEAPSAAKSDPSAASAPSGEPKPAPGDSAGEDTETDDSSDSSSARRRRRRRRRAGVAEEMEDLSAEDPPNTVVKVREARRPKDEITSVRGSTRIEAKKQRRRDGREAGRRRPPILTEAEFLARREAVSRVMCVREHGDRTQIAVLEDGILVEHYVNRAESSSLVGNVYLGKVQNVLPSMEAAFVDIGRGRNAVLYAGEVNWDAAGLEGQPKRIELAMKSGDPVLVQVTKDPIGHKGARLTSQISLPGRFLVYVPEGSMTGISRKLPDTERGRLKSILKDIVPDGAGVIVRTAAEGASEEQLTADVTRLAAQWEDITKKAKSASPPSLLYGEPDLAIKVVRDIFNEDFTELLVQGQETWDTLSEYIGWVAPDLLPKASRWVENEDLYAAYRIDEQLAKALDRKVWLPSGGSLVIDRTEAMTVIDVNTGKFTGQGGNLEETVTSNNLEAAEEIVRQLRLRDIGGIIVVDFIDMVLESNRDLVLRRLVECLGRDRTKHQVAEVTSLGLVQMTRKRIGQGLLEVFSTPCEHCGGRGHLVSAEPVSSDQGEDPDNRRDRGNRRSRKKTVPALGGKQTGRTPPPPKFDDEGHPIHDEEPGSTTASSDEIVEGSTAGPPLAEAAEGAGPMVAGSQPDDEASQPEAQAAPEVTESEATEPEGTAREATAPDPPQQDAV